MYGCPVPATPVARTAHPPVLFQLRLFLGLKGGYLRLRGRMVTTGASPPPCLTTIRPASLSLARVRYFICRFTPKALSSPFGTLNVRRPTTVCRRQIYSATTSSNALLDSGNTPCSHQTGQPMNLSSNGVLLVAVRRGTAGSSVSTSVILPWLSTNRRFDMIRPGALASPEQPSVCS